MFVSQPSRLSSWAAALTLAASCSFAFGIDQDETTAVLVDAVTTATLLDLYNARCRSDNSGRRSDNLNKQLVSIRRTTVLSVKDDLFPERDYRRVQQRLETEFMDILRELGGCRGVKASGLPDTLRARYDGLLERIELLP